MKMNCWLVLSLLAATAATAQTSTNALPPIPAPASVETAPAATVQTNAPAKKAVKHRRKTAAKKKAPKKVAAASKIFFSEPTITLQPGPAEVVADHLNVRGQAGLKGEVVAHLQKGDSVTVLSEITLDKHKADEPAQWAKIALPAGAPVWVDSSFIDAATKTVKPKRLNLRAGPGENYSVIGVIESGTAVTETGTKGNWTKIEAPANAFAYIAAMYLKQESSGNVPTNIPPSTEVAIAPEPAPTPATIPNEPTPIAPAPAPQPSVNPVPPAPALAETNMTTTTTSVTTVDTNTMPAPRIVTHEGYVRSSVSPVAPTYFELYDPNNNVAIDYLRSSTTNLNLSHYNGFHIVVTGAEGLDARWKDTPVLTIERIYVLSTNPPATPIYYSPRARTAH